MSRHVLYVLGLFLAFSLSGADGFSRVDPRGAGISFTNRIAPARYLTNQIPLNGSGVALGDIDGDALPDVVFAGLEGAGQIYRNLGQWRFASLGAESGVDWAGHDATGVALADLDGDADLDLLVNTLGRGTRLFANEGRGRFVLRQTVNVGRAGMSFAIADFDGDGDLDVYVTNYRGVTVRDEPGGRFSIRDEGQGPRVIQYNGRPTTEPDLAGRFTVGPGGVRENGEPDALFVNEGGWRFTAREWSDGTFRDEEGQPMVSPPYDWGLSAMARDFTGDGRPDLYVCNDFESLDRFWINETVPGGSLRFRAVAMLALRSTSAFSMGVDAADVDRDGRVDFLVLDMLSREHRLRNVQVEGLPRNMAMPGLLDDRPQFSRNTLFRARGDGTFAEIGRLAGVAASEWSWTPVFLDVDLDGYEDLLISNGHEMDMMDADVSAAAEVMKSRRRMTPREQLDLRKGFRRLDAPNAAFRNRGDLTFEDVSSAWGFDVREVAIGMAGADLDGDGDMDLVVNNLNSGPTLYRNESPKPRLGIRLKGSGTNTRGIGARLRVSGGPVVQSQEMIAGGRYLSSDDPMRVFAAGSAKSLDVEVTWRSGRTTRVTNATPGQTIEIAEAGASDPAPAREAEVALFADATDRLGFVHGENAFDDFARQPLLPRNLSQPGPGLSWSDLNGDGADDLVVGAGQGALVGVLLGDGKGGFRREMAPGLDKPAGRDLTTLLPFPPSVLAGSSNYEDGLTNGGAIRIFDLARKVTGEALLNQRLTVGPMAAADADGDGAVEIFIGGRALPGAYPQASDSMILRSSGGRLAPVQRLQGLGVVNDAVFADLDLDGRSELILACEWGPVRVLALVEQAWVDRTAAWGLEKSGGLWNSVAVGDFDSDGRPDVMAGNWGRNVLLGSGAGQLPLRLRAGDLDGSGTVEVIESYVGTDGQEWPVRKYGAMSEALPMLRERFPTHGAFGGTNLAGVLGEAFKSLPVLEAGLLDSCLWLQRGGRFERRPLPIEAQFSPVFGVAVADFDGDGNEDAFLGQNFFAVHPEDARQDGGAGVLLLGDGAGGFRALSPSASGIAVHGEARGAAVADFDGDGRTDLAVAQNGAAVRLFRNRGGAPGLRVSVEGGQANPMAVGAQVRLWAGGKAGPVRGIQMGGGYWSCPSPVVIPASRAKPEQVEVRWPGGRTIRAAIPAGASRIRVTLDGKVTTQP